MVDAINNVASGAGPVGAPVGGPDDLAPGSMGPAAGGAAAAPGKSAASSFAEVLGNSIDDVSRMQQDAAQAVQDLATGKSDDVTGVMTAVEKSDMAFKTLLAIRSKLMDAYEEIKQMQM